jgi:mono/diheme cytochrome c family protein
MSRLRGQSVAFVAACLFLIVAVTWGCGGGQKSQEQSAANPPAGGTATPSAGGSAAAGGEVSLAVGERVFTERCQLCHGPQGMGDGPGGAALNPKPRNFHTVADTLSDAWMYHVITNGWTGTGMPPWKAVLSESEIRSVMLKIHTFKKS